MARWFNWNKDSDKSPIQQAKEDYKKNNSEIGRNLGDVDIPASELPSEYNSTPYHTVVNGISVNTVGEYKAECAKYDRLNMG